MTDEQRVNVAPSTSERSGTSAGARTASREAWWIARLVMETGDYTPVKVGDWAIEVTHLIVLGRRGLALDCAIGKIVEVRPDSCYLIELRDGSQMPWENASFRKIPTPPSAPAPSTSPQATKGDSDKSFGDNKCS